MLEMLGHGAELPEGCKLDSAGVEYTVIKAKYRCEFGKVAIELAYPTADDPAEVETDSFRVAILEGSPPQGFLDALTAVIREHEAEFVWVDPAAAEPESPAAPQ